MRTKRFTAWLLTFAMLITMLPGFTLTASAADTTTKSIMLGTDHIAGGQQSNVYFGRYQQSSCGNTQPSTGTDGVDWIKSSTATKKGQGAYYSKDPVKWRVLSNANGKAFLLSDKNLDVVQYHTSSTSGTWETSTIRTWLNGTGTDDFYGSAFSADEKAHIAETEVINATYDGTNGTNPNPSYSTSGGNDTIDKIFLLSIAEARNKSYGFVNSMSQTDLRKSVNTAYVYGGGHTGASVMEKVGNADIWWLRSPGNSTSYAYAAIVSYSGNLEDKGKMVDSPYFTVRPAFNLNLSSVIFTSAAEGGKPDGFNAVSDYGGTDWKLTLKDDSRSSFSASVGSVVCSTSEYIATINYSGAATGTNEYISAMIKDADGNVTYYGRLKKVADTADASGTIEIDLSGKMNAADTLYIFNEQYNGDYKTDYASELKEVTIPSTINAGDVTFETNGGTINSGNFTFYAYGTAAALPTDVTKAGYTFGGWYANADLSGGKVTEIAVTETGNKTYYAKWTSIPATAPTVSAVSADLTGANALTYGEITADNKLTVTATADSGAEYDLSYQWHKATSASSKDGAEEIQEATEAGYAIPTNTSAGDYYYYCTVTATRKDNGESVAAETRIISVTVNKLPVTIDWGTTSFVYDGTEKALNPTVKNPVSGDTVSLTVTDNAATAAGDYTANVTDVSDNNYTLDGVETTKAWNIVQSATDFEGGSIKAYKGGIEATEFTYGDTITVKVKPYATGTAASVMLMSLAAPTENQMALYLGDIQISEAVNADGDGYYTMNVDTTQTALAYGSITLSAKYVGTDNMASHSEDVKITLSKAGAVQTAAPSAVQGLIYNGEQQTLVTAGSEVTGGTIKYKLADGEYSKELPKAANADTYTVYYKIFGDENHSDSTEQSFTVTVNKLPVNITWNMPQSLVFDGSEKTITAELANKVGNDSINFTIDGTVTATNKGEYTATVTAIDNENYTLINGENLTKTWSVAETTNTFTTNLAITGWVFGETPNAPTATAAFGTPEYTYSSSIDGAYNADVPTEAGTYYVKATVTGTENYAELVSEAVEFTILLKPINTEIPLTAPAGNAAPQTEIETDEYTGAVVWSPEVTDKFAYSTAYTATITITPKANYTLMGISENSYTANGAEIVTNEADSGNVTVTYAETRRRPSVSSSVSGTYCTVKFEVNGGSTIADKTVTRNSTISEPAEPAKDGYTFDGWYTDKKFTTAYDFDTKVTKNFTIYAKWTENEVDNTDGKKDETDDKTDTPDTTVWENPFEDVEPDDWYYGDVEYAVENGLMGGTTTTTFAPDGIITRAMLVTVLYRNEGEPAVGNDLRVVPFGDVADGMYYTNAVIWAKQNGIVSGVSESEFAPDEYITREQIATIMHRYAQYKDAAPTGAWAIRLDYADLADISDYAVEAVMYCKLKGIMQGKENNNFAPKDNATRAETAAILHRFIEANK